MWCRWCSQWRVCAIGVSNITTWKSEKWRGHTIESDQWLRTRQTTNGRLLWSINRPAHWSATSPARSDFQRNPQHPLKNHPKLEVQIDCDYRRQCRFASFSCYNRSDLGLSLSKPSSSSSTDSHCDGKFIDKIASADGTAERRTVRCWTFVRSCELFWGVYGRL